MIQIFPSNIQNVYPRPGPSTNEVIGGVGGAVASELQYSEDCRPNNYIE